ncbi:hypothetical protein SEVIR_6G233601v4 [Setaria viridis]
MRTCPAGRPPAGARLRRSVCRPTGGLALHGATAPECRHPCHSRPSRATTTHMHPSIHACMPDLLVLIKWQGRRASFTARTVADIWARTIQVGPRGGDRFDRLRPPVEACGVSSSPERRRVWRPGARCRRRRSIDQPPKFIAVVRRAHTVALKILHFSSKLHQVL